MISDIDTRKTLKIIYHNPVSIAIGFGWDKLYPKNINPLHNNWLKKLIFATDEYLLMAHRESYKTTCVICAIAIRMIIFPNDTIAFLRKTDKDIKEVISGVKKCLLSDTALGLVYNIWNLSDLDFIKESSDELTTTLFTSVRGSAQLTGIGIGGSIVGKHYDVIYTDDICTKSDRSSKAEREQTKTNYGELGNILNDRSSKYTGITINTGTPWHKDDVYQLMPKPDKYTYLDTGILSEEKIIRQKKRLTPALFTTNYLLDHRNDADNKFTDAKFFGSVDSDMNKIYYGSAHVDCAYGGDNSTALTIMNKHNNCFYGFGAVWDDHVRNCYGEIKKLCNKFKVQDVYIEDNADKGYVENDLFSLGLFTCSYHENQNKSVKIMTYLYNNWLDCFWHITTDPDYIIQIVDYAIDVEPDDAPDSAASLIRAIDDVGEAFIL